MCQALRMRRRVLVTFFIIVSSVVQVQTRNRTFTYGTFQEFSVEQEVIDHAFNDTSYFDEAVLKRFIISENTTLLHQALILVQEDVIAMIEGSHINTSDACALSVVTGIPVISLRRDTRPTDGCLKTLQIQAGYRTYAHATLDILNKFQWKNIALLYEVDLLQAAGYFYSISQGSELTVTFVQIAEKEESDDKTKAMSTAMEKIGMLIPDVILLYASNREILELFLKKNSWVNVNGYTWILQGQVPGNLSSRPEYVVLAYKLPYNENLAPEELEKEDNTDYFGKELAAVAYDAVQVINKAQTVEPCLSINGSAVTSKDRETMFSCLTKVKFEGITGPVRFSQDGERAVVQLDILNLRNDSFRKVGTWNATTKAVMFENIHHNMNDKFHGGGLAGRILRVVVIEDEPFVVLKRQEDGSITHEGYCIDLLRELSKRLHFSYHIETSPDGLYGGKLENGSWNGMIGELLNNRADVAVAALTITESREKVADFTVPFMYYSEEMLLKKASINNGSIDFLQFMNPFRIEVWFVTLATLVVISVSTFVINYFSPYGHKDANGRGTSEEFSFFNSVWFSLACMLQQGSESQPRSLSGRILAACYWFCILVWVSTYTANLAAFFTVKNAVAPINNLEDILTSSYKVTIVEYGSTYDFFQTSQYETHRKIWYRIQAHNSLVGNTSEAAKLVRGKDDYVFIYDGPVVRHLANNPPCDVITVPGLSTAKGLGLAFQADDPDVTDFSLAILHLHENSFLENLKRKWWESSNGCPQEQETMLSRKRIGLTSMAGVYAVLGVGLILSFLVLIAEIIWKRKEKLKTTRSNVRSIRIHPRTN